MTAFNKSLWAISEKGMGGPQSGCPDCKGEGYIRMAGLTFRCERCPKWSWEK